MGRGVMNCRLRNDNFQEERVNKIIAAVLVVAGLMPHATVTAQEMEEIIFWMVWSDQRGSLL
jgi:hypothetical protein